MSNMALLGASTLVLACGLGAAFIGKRNKAVGIALGVLVLVFLLLTCAFLAANQFTGHGIDQAVLYHVQYGLEGAGFAEYWTRILSIGVLLFAGTALAYASARLANRASARRYPVSTAWLSLPLGIGSCLLNPATHDLHALFGGGDDDVPSLGPANASAFSTHYRRPELGAEPPARRNFVFIYAEGLERTYFDESLFPGLIVGMRELEGIGTSFTNVDQTDGTTFTIGGMVGSQCGIPLVTASGVNSMSGMEKFLPNAVCVGDLLRDRGYHLAFIGGASLRFAGKGEFLQAHGFDEMQGREQLQPLVGDMEYRSAWGLFDDSLFDLAHEKFLALSAGNKSFGLFLLTLDTHAPDGHLSRRVADVRYGNGDTPMLNAVAGTDKLLHAFVQRIMATPQGKDTVIVICSDHLAMKNGASARLNDGVRKNLFLIIDPRNPKPVRVDKPGTTLDIGPTVLGALGYPARLGLGRNLTDPEPTVREQLGDMSKAIAHWRRELSGFWGLSELHSMQLLPESGMLEVGGTRLRTPVLITFDRTLRADVFFEFDNAKSLSEYVSDLAQGTPFVWVAPCSQARGFLEGDEPSASDCLVVGKRGAAPVVAISAERASTLSEQQLRQVLATREDPQIYEQQSLGLLETQLPRGLGELFRRLPPGSTFFSSHGPTAQRIERYLRSTSLASRQITITQTPPVDREFYFTATDLGRFDTNDGYDVQPVPLGGSLLEILQQHAQDLVILAAKDDARSRLSARTIQHFGKLGIDLTTLKFRGSFAAVLEGGRVLAASIANGTPVVLQSPELLQRGIDRVESAGFDAGNVAKIILGGRDVSGNSRGLNMVVLTRDGNRLSMTIDTAVSERLYSNMFMASPR